MLRNTAGEEERARRTQITQELEVHALLVTLRAHRGGCRAGSHHTLRLCCSSTDIGSWGAVRPRVLVSQAVASAEHHCPQSGEPKLHVLHGANAGLRMG